MGSSFLTGRLYTGGQFDLILRSRFQNQIMAKAAQPYTIITYEKPLVKHFSHFVFVDLILEITWQLDFH